MFCIAFDETGIKGGKKRVETREKKAGKKQKKKDNVRLMEKKVLQKKNGLDVKSIVTRGSKIVV